MYGLSQLWSHFSRETLLIIIHFRCEEKLRNRYLLWGKSQEQGSKIWCQVVRQKQKQQNYQRVMSKNLVQTHNNPLNRSISKQLYSFSKASRFEAKRQPLCNRAFYDIKKNAFNDRTTTFGYGNKIDFINREPNPPVGNYQLKDQFAYNRYKNRGYSFSKNNKPDGLDNPERFSLLPGPGAYNHNREKSANKFATLSFTMGSKLEDQFNKHQNHLGPGQYETIPSISKTGSYYYSKYGNSGCSKIGRAQRLSINDPSITPGPGKYRSEDKVGFNKTGVYFYSKFRNMEASKFGLSNRPPMADIKPVPGPGTYGQFSQFASINKSWIRASTAGKN